MADQSIAKLYADVVKISRERAFSAKLRLYLIIAYFYVTPLLLVSFVFFIGPSGTPGTNSRVWLYWMLKLCLWIVSFVGFSYFLRRIAIQSILINNLLLFLFFVLSQLLFGSVGGAWPVGTQEELMSFVTPFFMQVAFQAGLGIEIFQQLRFFEKGVASGTYLRILDDKAGVVGQAVKELSHYLPVKGRMFPKIELWLDTRPKSWLPSTHASGNTFYLIIPRKFLIDSGKDVEITKAIVAHEIGHIIQGDASLWLINNIFSGVLRKKVLPLATLSMSSLIVFSLLAGGGLPKSLAAAYAPIFIMNQFVGKVRHANTYSEHYADLAAAILISPIAIVRALQYAFKHEAEAEIKLISAYQAFQKVRPKLRARDRDADPEIRRLYKKFGIDVRQDPPSPEVCQELGIQIKQTDSAPDADRQVDQVEEYIEALDKFKEAEKELERLRMNPIKPTLRERSEYIYMVLEKYGLISAVNEPS